MSIIKYLILIIFLIYAASAYDLNFDRGNNPKNIKFDSVRSNNYFLVIGDWGQHNGGNADCQYQIGQQMRDYVNQQKQAGRTLLFISALGDNFYWSGQSNCDQNGGGPWKSVWSDVYKELATDYYWFPVMGNHDYGPSDKYAMCPSKQGKTRASHQLTECSPEKYHMQDFAYFYRFDELKFEYIGLDTNRRICPGGIGGDGKSWYFSQCGGTGPACDFLNDVQEASKALLRERASQSTAESIFTAQHYDNACQDTVFPTLGNPPNAKDIRCAHGHVHQVQCVQKEYEYLLQQNIVVQGSCNNVVQGRDRYGNDIHNSPASSSDECCSMCNSYSGCTSWVYQTVNHVCYLKSGTGTTEQCSTCTYGEPSSSSGGSCKATTTGQDHYGDDVYSEYLANGNAGQCCDICNSRSDCVSYVWQTVNSKCYIKGGSGHNKECSTCTYGEPGKVDPSKRFKCNGGSCQQDDQGGFNSATDCQNACKPANDDRCKVIMSGAGGGCCGESNPYGFSAVHLTDDGRMATTTNVHPIYKGQCGWSQKNAGNFLRENFISM